jgi:hypothetical protein
MSCLMSLMAWCQGGEFNKCFILSMVEQSLCALQWGSRAADIDFMYILLYALLLNENVLTLGNFNFSNMIK